MSTHDTQQAQERFSTPVLFVCAVILSVVLLSLGSSVGSPAFRSPEVSFTDLSTHGLAIVPASCPSAPPGATSDAGGYVIPSGTNGAQVTADGVRYCVSNYSGQTLFVPVRTIGELNSFLGAMPGGVSQRAPASYPWYCWYGYGGAYNYMGGC